MAPICDACEMNMFTRWEVITDMLMNGILNPIPPASTNPTMIKMADIIPFFAANPKIRPSTNKRTIEIIEE